MSITATEFKQNFSKYIAMALTEDIYITQYGKVVAKITKPFQEKLEIADSLIGVLSDEVMLEESREERLSKI